MLSVNCTLLIQDYVHFTYFFIFLHNIIVNVICIVIMMVGNKVNILNNNCYF